MNKTKNQSKLIKISAVIITLNSERTLSKVLESINGWADEIVVVDSGSTDSTLHIANKFNCTIFHRDFDGYGPQKNFAIDKAKNDWVFSLDSDEVLTHELKKEINQVLNQNPPDVTGFLVPLTLYFLGKPMRFGKENKMPILRLFNKKYGNFSNNMVHENIELKGKIRKLKHQFIHYSYADLEDYLTKFNKYTTLAAKELNKKNKHASVFKIILRLPFSFLKEYFFNFNFLNGYRGFIWAVFSAFYPMVKYAKLREINSNL
jgi:glycosyltransferase involved in cell wall biosynthesis